MEVRLAAAEELGALNDTSGQDIVYEVFKENMTADMDLTGKTRVYIFTALAIGKIGTTNLTRFLPQLLEDESKLVRIAAAKAVLQCSAANQ